MPWVVKARINGEQVAEKECPSADSCRTFAKNHLKELEAGGDEIRFAYLIVDPMGRPFKVCTQRLKSKSLKWEWI